jgi:hypothetical protein
MKLKNRILMLMTVCGALMLPKATVAAVFPDQEVIASDSQDENSDAVSRFGAPESGSVEEAEVRAAMKARRLPPISDSSFESGTDRVPARVPASPGRSPAGAVKIMASDTSSHPASVVRKAVQNRAVQEVAVIANETGFYPATVFLTRGIDARVFITGASKKSQCFMADSFGIRRQVRSQRVEEVTFTPDRTGTFTFHCPMNGARGRFVVKELEFQARVPASETGSQSVNSASLISEQDFTPEFRKH